MQEDQDAPMRLTALERDVSDIKSLMSKMVDALTRMALLEERQQTVQLTTDKILAQIQDIKDHQATIDLAAARNAVSAVSPTRVEAIEKSVLENHIEHERNKARYQTLVRTIQVAYVGFVGLIGAVAWLYTNTHVIAK